VPKGDGDDYEFIEYGMAKIGLVYESEDGPPQIGIVVPDHRGKTNYLALLPTAEIELTSSGRGWGERDIDPRTGYSVGPGTLSLGIKLKPKDDDDQSG